MGYLIFGIIIFLIAVILLVVAIMVRKEEPQVFTGLMIGFFLLAILSSYLSWAQFNTAGGERAMKTFKSDRAGGLTRTVDVYDNYGHKLQHYEGKLDVETNDAGTKVLFDLNGKRTIIYGAIVIVQEK